MKKISAILLIAVFLFNLFGYRLVFEYAQHQADLMLVASLDKNDFDESELITIKVPLSLPYQNNQEEFERVDGELTVNGKIYKYVKRRIADGQLILMCLPDHRKMQLQSEKEDFFKHTNDVTQNASSKKSNNSKSGLVKCPVEEFDNYTFDYQSTHTIVPKVYTVCKPIAHLPTTPHLSPDQPPELV